MFAGGKLPNILPCLLPPGHCLLAPPELRQRRCHPWAVATKHPATARPRHLLAPLALLSCSGAGGEPRWHLELRIPTGLKLRHPLLSSFRRFMTFAEAEILVRECIYAISDAIRRCVASRAFSYLIFMRCDASSSRCSILTTSTLVLLVVQPLVVMLRNEHPAETKKSPLQFPPLPINSRTETVDWSLVWS